MKLNYRFAREMRGLKGGTRPPDGLVRRSQGKTRPECSTYSYCIVTLSPRSVKKNSPKCRNEPA